MRCVMNFEDMDVTLNLPIGTVRDWLYQRDIIVEGAIGHSLREVPYVSAEHLHLFKQIPCKVKVECGDTVVEEYDSFTLELSDEGVEFVTNAIDAIELELQKC